MTTTRRAELRRDTAETRVRVAVDIDGAGAARIATGIGFLDHMLELLARHSLIDLTVEAEGDLHVDMHHTTEDVGIVIGQALREALGERRGIRRYASLDLPMDETLTRVAVDVSGRPVLVWRVAFPSATVGGMDCELFREWFHALAHNAGITLHVETFYGENAHHMAESCFKGLARVLREALSIDPREADRVPSTKGSLTA